MSPKSPLPARILIPVANPGTAGQPYSPLSHRITELGEEGVSGLAAVINAGARGKVRA